MQKKLLSLLMVAACSIIYGDISKEEYEKNQQQYDVLKKELNDLEEIANKKQEEKDAIEIALYLYDQRKGFRQRFKEQAMGKKDDAIDKYKKDSDKNADEVNSERKLKDNGISRAWFSGVTDPIPGSRADKVYKRANGLKEKTCEVNKKLSEEYTGYVNNQLKKSVLPTLKKTLEGKSDSMKSFTASFVQCDCYSGDEYTRCLDEEGITNHQRNENFPEMFIMRAYKTMYEQLIKEGISADELILEEFIQIAENNVLTQDIVAKVKVAQENLRKAIKRESLEPKSEGKPNLNQDTPPAANPLADNPPKPNILTDEE